MKNGRGWYNEPVRHALAARGIKTWHRPNLKAGGVATEGSIHDRIWNMARKNTGSHFLDSGRAYGYIYDTPIAEEGLYRRPGDIRYLISTPHWLENILAITDDSERYNEMLQKIIAEGDNDSYLDDVDELITNLRNEGHRVEAVWKDNTYNHDNDFNQEFQFTIFKVDRDKNMIAVQTHNGCDVRGGYPGPQVFEIEDMDYFSDWRVHYSGECDVDVAQTKLTGGHLQHQYADYEDFLDYGEDFKKAFGGRHPDSVFDRDEMKKFVNDKTGEIMCPKCKKIHIHPYNPVIDGY
jgi:hypothetical protein